jgi:competence protein ComGC
MTTRAPVPSALATRWGFTRADLLLVLGGVALLVVLAMTSVARSREATRLARCIDNVQKVNGALLQYATEHGRTFPLLQDSPAPGGWFYYKEEIKGFLGLTGQSSAADTVFACPSDRGYYATSEKAEPFCRSAKFDYTSYVYNGVTVPGVPSIAGRPLDSIKEPARTLSVMEWTAHGPLSWHRSRTGMENSPFYDGAENVVGFVDGHVRLTPIHYDGINAAYTRDPIPGYDYKFSGD